VLQVDGYAGYRAFANKNGAQLAFCWAHVRRRFYELADTDEAGHAFQYEAGHLFQSEAGRRSDLMSATGVALLQIGLNDVSRFERGQAGSFFVAAERRLRRLSPESSIR
jgi:hypothetical protein